MRYRTEKDHTKYWQERKIDWKEAYSSTWDHPHRDMMCQILEKVTWGSLFEIGCASGPNLIKLVKTFPNVIVGGSDISEDAIAEAKRTFKGAHLEVGPVEDIMMSDDSTDVVLSDMTLIYVSNINKAISEMKRVARNYVLLCELHSESWFDRIKMRFTSGYYVYNYKKILKKQGFRNVTLIKIPTEVWDGKPQKPYGYFILAEVPKTIN